VYLREAVGLECDGVECHRHVALPQLESETLLKLGLRQGVKVPDVVQSQGSDGVHARGILAHANHALAVLLGRYEVEQTQLGHSVSEGIIHRAECRLATVQVGHGDARELRCYRSREGFVAIPEQHHEVWLQLVEGGRHARHCGGECRARAHGAVVIHRQWDLGVDTEAIFADLGGRAAVRVREVRAGQDQSDIERGGGLELLQHGHEESVLGSASGHHTDSHVALHGSPNSAGCEARRPQGIHDI